MILPFKKKTKNSIQITDSLEKDILDILKRRNITLNQFIAESIELRSVWVKNARPESRLVIENPKDGPDNYNLLLEEGRNLFNVLNK